MRDAITCDVMDREIRASMAQAPPVRPASCYDPCMSSLPVEHVDEPVASDREQPPPPARARASNWLQFLLIAGAVVVLDQITKRFVDAHLALGESWPSESWPFRVMHVKNTGAAFSMLQNQTLFLTIMSLVGLAAIVLYFRYRPSDHPLLRIALALQLGGAVGNLIDRALYGHVTDFLKIPNWPVFNVADSAISVGVATVVIFLVFGGDGAAKQPAPAR